MEVAPGNILFMAGEPVQEANFDVIFPEADKAGECPGLPERR